jgi:hypothetical protein
LGNPAVLSVGRAGQHAVVPDVVTHGQQRPRHRALTHPALTHRDRWQGTGRGEPAAEAGGVAAFELVEDRLPQRHQLGAGRFDQYQVRSWRAWYAHITLAMLAAAYLAATRAAEIAREADKGDLEPAATS